MEITRLNADSSWLIQLGDFRFVLDPWLVGAQIDGVAWFSKQWHAQPCAPMSEIGKIDGIVISHPFTDHCHKETMLGFPAETPVWAAPSAAKTIRSWNHFHTVYAIGFQKPVTNGDVQIEFYPSKSWIDPVHDAMYFKDKRTNESIFYAPHGFKISPNRSLPEKVTLLITTTITYNLPFWLGGTVNLGKSAAKKLAEKVRPKHLVYTHNEHKHAEGLVSKLAKPDWDESLKLSQVSVLIPELSKSLYLN
jgi:hypothetical protein